MKNPLLQQGASAEGIGSESTLTIPGAENFLSLLGKDPAKTWFRTITPKKGANRFRSGRDLQGFDPALLHSENRSGAAIYFITGDADAATGRGGGVDDSDVHTCRSVFAEWDDKPMDWQVTAWRELGLPEPSAMVATGGKSIHCYWVLSDPLDPERWRQLQDRLIQHCSSDPKCRNPARLMRVPGFSYIDKQTGEVTSARAELIHRSEATYTASEIDACLRVPSTPDLPLALPRPAQFPPRGLDEIRAAAEFIPERISGQATESPHRYEPSRHALCGCAAALAEIGEPEELALDLLASKWPSRQEAEQVLRSSTTRNAASFWKIARDNGFALKRSVPGQNKSLSPSVQPDPLGTSTIKPISLGAGAVVATLPQRVGVLRLNNRTQDVHSKNEVISINQLSRLYLTLSNPVETWPKDATYDAALLLAQQNSFDPIAQYLDSNQASPISLEDWRRLDQFLLGIDDSIAAAFLPRYLMAAVARTREPGCDFRQAPVLVGPQWTGKTVLGRKLFGKDYFVSGLKKLDKDDLLRCHTAWGVELAEMNGLTNATKQEELKMFISEVSDRVRWPYDKTTERLDRRFLFWGTSNSPPFRDTTGNSRYVGISVDRLLPLDRVEENRDAIWRRAVLQYEAGENWKECDKASREAISLRNENFSDEDPWLRPVANFLDRRLACSDLPVHVPDILNALEVPVERHSNQVASRVQRLAESLGWKKGRRTYLGKRVLGLWPSATSTPRRSHTAGTPPKPSSGGGSGFTATPDMPPSKEIGEESGGGGQVRPDTFASAGVAEVPTGANPLHWSQLDVFDRCGSSHSQPVNGVAEIGSSWDSESV